MMRCGSVSEVRTVSSTNPVCFFKMGRTFSLMVFASSLAFPDLALISTTRVNIGLLLSSVKVLKGTFAAGRGDGLVFIGLKYVTPFRRMCQLAGTVATICG